MVTWLRTFEHDSDMIGGFTPFPSEIIHFQGSFSFTWPCLRRCLTRSWRSKSRSNKRRCSCSSGAWRALVFGDSQGLCWLGKWSPGKPIFLNSCFLFRNLERHRNAWIWRKYDIIWLTCSTVSYHKDSCIRNRFQSFTIDKAGSAFQFRADDCSIQCA